MRAQGGGRIVNISSGTPFRGVPVPAALRHEQGRDRGAHAGAGQGARRRRACSSTASRPGFTMSDGVHEHPEVIEALQDVSVGARTIKRDQVPDGRRRRGGLPVRPGRDVHHRPDDGHRRRPVLPLRLSLTEHAERRASAEADRASRHRVDEAHGAARSTAARSCGSSTRGGAAPARCCRAEVELDARPSGSCAATASTSSRAASPTATPTPARASATCSSARSRSTR